MENEHVLSGLIRKRAEIAGQLEAAQMQVRQLITDLDSLDATIRLFAPSFDIAALRPKHMAPPHVAFHGQVARILMDLLRDAKAPVTINDAARFVMEQRGLNTFPIRGSPSRFSGVSGRVCGTCGSVGRCGHDRGMGGF